MSRWPRVTISPRLRLDSEFAVLGVLLVLGGLLRLAMMLAVRPITYGLDDSGTYMAAVSGWFPRLFWDVHHPVGYPIFLALASPIVQSGTGLAILQHLLGLGAVALLYFAGRGFGAPRWASAVGAGAYALSIDVVQLEHSVLSEALYMPAIAVFLFAASRIYCGGRLRRVAAWAVLLGVSAGIAYTARYPGAALAFAAPIAAACLSFGSLKSRLAVGMVAGVAAFVVIGSYLAAQDAEMGIGWPLFPGQGWNHYTAIAAGADCSRFKPPPGTRVLCETAAERQGKTPEFYSWSGASPARKLEPRGFPYSDSKFEAFAEAAANAGSGGARTGQRHGAPGLPARVGSGVTSLVRKAGIVFGSLGWAPELNFRNSEPVEANERAIARGLFEMQPMSFHPPLQPLLDLRPLLRVSPGMALVALLALIAAVPRLGVGRGLFAVTMLAVIVAWVNAGQLPRYAVPIYELSVGLFPLAVAGLTGGRAPRARARPVSPAAVESDRTQAIEIASAGTARSSVAPRR